jgi:hypothetical protein
MLWLGLCHLSCDCICLRLSILFPRYRPLFLASQAILQRNVGLVKHQSTKASGSAAFYAPAKPPKMPTNPNSPAMQLNAPHWWRPHQPTRSRRVAGLPFGQYPINRLYERPHPAYDAGQHSRCSCRNAPIPLTMLLRQSGWARVQSCGGRGGWMIDRAGERSIFCCQSGRSASQI